MFQHIVYSLANRQGLLAYVRTCKTRLDTTTKFMAVVTSLFNLVISSFPDNMYYHVWTWLLIYHDGSNNVVQVCSFIKPWTVCSNMHEQACQQPCSNWTSSNKLCVFTCVVYVFTVLKGIDYREQPADYLKQYKNAGKRFRVYGARATKERCLCEKTEGKYFPVQTEKTRLIRNLLYGFWFIFFWSLQRFCLQLSC